MAERATRGEERIVGRSTRSPLGVLDTLRFALGAAADHGDVVERAKSHVAGGAEAHRFEAGLP